MGGGGIGFAAYGGGGGSGHLVYHSLQVSAGTLLTGHVGDQGQSSSLIISSGDTFIAESGEDGQGYYGGDGYSGGGGGGGFSNVNVGGDGGTDGGDGVDGYYTGGAGTGEDISLYTFTTWSLGPGAGGQHDNYGGGGGGLMVDGAGPQASSYQGVGYGGGGGGYSGSHKYGLQGVILIEIH